MMMLMLCPVVLIPGILLIGIKCTQVFVVTGEPVCSSMSMLEFTSLLPTYDSQVIKELQLQDGLRRWQ